MLYPLSYGHAFRCSAQHSVSVRAAVCRRVSAVRAVRPNWRPLWHVACTEFVPVQIRWYSKAHRRPSTNGPPGGFSAPHAGGEAKQGGAEAEEGVRLSLTHLGLRDGPFRVDVIHHETRLNEWRRVPFTTVPHLIAAILAFTTPTPSAASQMRFAENAAQIAQMPALRRRRRTTRVRRHRLQRRQTHAMAFQNQAYLRSLTADS
jgi:hypothetical protein